MLLIHTAREARTAVHTCRQLLRAPDAFHGPLEELYERFIVPNLPEPAAVADFHRALVEFLGTPDPLHLLRQVRGTERGAVYETDEGVRFKATDNAPAWWTHAALFQEVRVAPGAMGDVVATMPAHLFEVSATCPPTANMAGWHIAHLADVKDGYTNYRVWAKQEVVRRFIRNVHPCNHCLLPKPEWQRWGADRRVTGFAATRFAARYADVWDEFALLANVDRAARSAEGFEIAYTYGVTTEDQAREGVAQRRELHLTSRSECASGGVVVACYTATRLTFRAAVIEPLADDERFRVVTPDGTFEMTKAQFHRVFANVVRSVSYRERGVYHYPSIPKAAAPFLIEEERPASGS
ncbi:hypothetical protein [Roseisolibacter agri]|uniref:Uncharacterized protein n=1 Tax=Roseisolibacter agri TaxID=2014610 RepID=A0AA37QJ12_9BACT|nr:hypothetical protein [Roseisolibacter agri]GLC27768.1 hypothetical protein rosag_42810 [Roseisolibacter agri]